MILDKRVKSQGISEEEYEFIILYSYEVNHYGATHPT